MKEFYVNIRTSSSGNMCTKVKYTEIEFNYTTLATILEIPYEGARGWNQRNWIINKDFNKEECVRLLFGENAHVMQLMYSRNLSLHHRFLHRAVSTHMLPKTGGFDEVTHMEAFTIFHIIMGPKINVPMLIINHMHAMHSRENARLPYSNIITKIVMHFGVDLSGEMHHALQSVDKLGKGTLGRMGFKKHKRLGTWIPREEDLNRVIEEEGEEVQGQEPREPQVEQTLNVNFPRTQFEELMEAIKGIKVDVQTIKRRQKRIKRRLTEKGMDGNEGLITSSSSQDDDANQRDDGATNDLEGDMDDPMGN
ncbi:hypothetical protein CFOL_v3_08755 [Cephalotus follicularis]|uniref:Putative plant transposon protein domain-containing protein n=1 Tax=Cephalotus follicularis TaxID=3775 RepID=A0A1Q3BB60_CEPFO|nr:hypothetical protein CFOL_v3_08755 [Cephalotus follicularis]